MENKFINVDEILSKKEKKTVLYESEHSNTAVINLKPGEQMPPHIHPNTDDVWVILRGRGVYLLDQKHILPLQTGMIIPNLQGEIHGIRNTSDEPLVLVAVSAPVPVQTTFLE